MKLSRRQFLQGLAAGMVVAAAPPAVRAAVIDHVKEETQLPWGFIVRGTPNPDLIMLPPGVNVPPGIAERFCTPFSYLWPEHFDVDLLIDAAEQDKLTQPIELCPWAPYRPAMEKLIPEELQWKSRNWYPRRFR